MSWQYPTELDAHPPTPAPWDNVIGQSKPFPDFTSISTATPSFMAGTVDLESQTKPPQNDLPAFNEARSQALKYFDVTTQEIQEKLVCTMLPHRMLATQQGSGELTAKFSEKPDLYGPFWICVTAAMATFVGSHGYLWATGEFLVTRYFSLYVAFVSIFTLWACAPVAVRLLCTFKGVDPTILRLEFVSCVYGYSLAALIPMALLCIMPSRFLQSIFILLGFCMSLAFLFINLLSDLSRLNRDLRFFIAMVMGTSHLILFLLYPFYFLRKN